MKNNKKLLILILATLIAAAPTQSQAGIFWSWLGNQNAGRKAFIGLTSFAIVGFIGIKFWNSYWKKPNKAQELYKLTNNTEPSVFEKETSKLLEDGKNPNKIINELKVMTLLHKAAKLNLPNLVEKLIALGAKVNGPNNIKPTPLHYACSNEHNIDCTKTIKMLISAGANLKAQDAEKNTPLKVANGNKAVTELLKNVSTAIDHIETCLSENKSIAKPNNIKLEIFNLALNNVTLRKAANRLADEKHLNILFDKCPIENKTTDNLIGQSDYDNLKKYTDYLFKETKKPETKKKTSLFWKNALNRFTSTNDPKRSRDILFNHPMTLQTYKKIKASAVKHKRTELYIVIDKYHQQYNLFLAFSKYGFTDRNIIHKNIMPIISSYHVEESE